MYFQSLDKIKKKHSPPTFSTIPIIPIPFHELEEKEREGEKREGK